MKYLLTLVLLAILCYPLASMAQVADPGNPDAPLDGGLGFLIAAGIGYGIRRAKKNAAAK